MTRNASQRGKHLSWVLISTEEKSELKEISQTRDRSSRATTSQMRSKSQGHVSQVRGCEFILRNTRKPCFFLKKSLRSSLDSVRRAGTGPFPLLGPRLSLQNGCSLFLQLTCYFWVQLTEVEDESDFHFLRHLAALLYYNATYVGHREKWVNSSQSR